MKKSKTRSLVERMEALTADAIETALRSPLVLEPSARGLTTVLRAKHLLRRALRRGWRMVGLPTRAEQERTLHLLNELESKLLDIEERLETIDARQRLLPSETRGAALPRPEERN